MVKQLLLVYLSIIILTYQKIRLIEIKHAGFVGSALVRTISLVETDQVEHKCSVHPPPSCTRQPTFISVVTLPRTPVYQISAKMSNVFRKCPQPFTHIMYFWKERTNLQNNNLKQRYCTDKDTASVTYLFIVWV